MINLGQNNLDKFTKFSELDFQMKFFAADFLKFSSTTIKLALKYPGFPRS